jgi:imidazolonepropionase-like amidohydrolase
MACIPQQTSVAASGSVARGEFAQQVRLGENFAVIGVRLFDGERVWPSATVVVEDGNITYVGEARPAELPVVVIDGHRMTLLPGLIDAHVHVDNEAALRDALLFGITTVLDMGARPGRAPRLRALRGRPDLADYFSAGVTATAPGGHGTQYGYERPTISSPGSADAFIAARVGEESDYIKIIFEFGSRGQFRNMDVPTLEALVRASHRHGKLAVVHVSRAVDAETAIRAGADGIVHIWWDQGAAPEVSALGASREAFVVPTISVWEGVWLSAAGGRRLAADERLRPLLSDAAIANLTEDGRIESAPDAVQRVHRERAPHLRGWMYEAVHDLHLAGVRILAGSDAPNVGTWHGVSLHRELELLVEAGLTPLEALRAATSVPADAFRLADRGRVMQGLRADLLLIDGDPTEDITTTRAIVGVWKKGVRLTSR